jgi:hypothetical protein
LSHFAIPLVASDDHPARNVNGAPACAKTRPIGLRSLAVVELEHAAEPLTAPDRACVEQLCLGRDEFVAQTLVRPFRMIMIMMDEL